MVLILQITEYLVVYNGVGLESVGQLFPALTRIRGNKLLFNNYALVVHDNPNLREVRVTSYTCTACTVKCSNVD